MADNGADETFEVLMKKLTTATKPNNIKTKEQELVRVRRERKYERQKLRNGSKGSGQGSWQHHYAPPWTKSLYRKVKHCVYVRRYNLSTTTPPIANQHYFFGS